MALPGTARRVGAAYVGELKPNASPSSLQVLSGPVRALDATIASQDAEFAQSTDGEQASILILTEGKPGKGKRAKPRFSGDLLLASGRYVIDADFGPGEPFIAGRVFKQNPAPSAKGGSRPMSTKKSGPKPRG